MKKFITILFFAGFLTTASYAQSGHRQQKNNQSNGKGYTSSQNSGNNRDQYSQNSRNDHGGYRDNEQNNRNNENDYGYNHDRDNRNRYMKEGRYHYQRQHYKRVEEHTNRNDHRSW